MRKKVADTEYRITILFADGNLYTFTILLNDHTVHGKRRGTPLVFADTAVIVGLKVCHIVFFINRIRF